MRTRTRSRGWRALMVVAAMGLLAACGGPPTEALQGAEDALLNAAFAKECAGENYRLAEQMLAEAKQANLEGDYETARKKAEAARMLADQAQRSAELGREDCEKKKRLQEDITRAIADSDPVNNLPAQDVIDGYDLETIYFPFDEATLTSDAKRILTSHADWLSSNATTNVVVEGHTDDSGSIEYNLALSHRRAQSVKQYLSRLGVESARMKIIPYGEEKPEDHDMSERGRSRNRRASFVIR